MRILFAMIFSMFLQATAHAGIMDGCYFSSDVSNTVNHTVNVKAIGDICDNTCSDACAALSVLSDDWGELNQDVINQCQYDCRSGSTNSRTYTYRTSGYNFQNYGATATKTINDACSTSDADSTSANYIAFDTQHNVSAGDIVKIKIIGDNYAGGIVYLCGAYTKYLTPKFWSLNPVDSGWNGLANTSAPTDWHAKNHNYTATGLDVQNGDYLDITYGHTYSGFCDAINHICVAPSTSCSQQGSWFSSSLQVRVPSGNAWLTTGAFDIIPGQSLLCTSSDSNGNWDATSASNAATNNQTVSWKGLGGNRWTAKNSADNGGVYNMFQFSGTVAGFSSNITPLGLRHSDVEPFHYWADNYGGYMVKASVKRCAYTKGQRLQYAIMSPSTTTAPSQWTWHNITNFDNTTGFATLNITSNGELYLRVKPLAASEVGIVTCNSNDPECQASKTRVAAAYGAKNAYGHYNTLVSKQVTGNNFSDLSASIQKIQNYLFGGNGQDGLVKSIFDNMLEDSNMLNAIRSVLVLYIALTALAFLTGMSNITQKEGVMRLAKFAVVAALIQPDSWNFFNTYLFKLITQGSVTLINDFATLPNETPAATPSDIFASVISTPWNTLTSGAVNAKLIALALSGPFGIFVAFCIAVALVTYMWCMFKALMIYLVSLVMISFLFIIAPIYICFILFNYTKKMFDTWIKQMISYALQPVIVFAAIAIMQPILYAAMYAALGFTVCPACFLELPVIGCVIETWQTLYYGTMMGGAAGMSPLASISSAFFFLVIAFCTYGLCIYASEVASFIATGQFVGSNLDDVGSNANPISYSGDLGMRVLGLDMKSYADRQRVRDSATAASSDVAGIKSGALSAVDRKGNFTTKAQGGVGKAYQSAISTKRFIKKSWGE